MIREVSWTAEELAEMPEHGFFEPVPLGMRVRLRIPEHLRDAHGGREWLVCGHSQDDASPIINGRLSSRYVFTYPPRTGTA